MQYPENGLPTPLGLDAFEGASDGLIDEALQAIREHFGMPVAYLSRFDGQRTVFRNVSAPGLEALIKPGDSRSLMEVYCPHILSGLLPNVIPNTAEEPLCTGLEITHQVPIGSHISLPVQGLNGEAYGMFCCLSPDPSPDLNDRDLAVMASFANLVAREVQREERANFAAAERARRIADVLSGEHFYSVYQPLVRLSDRAIVGFEALTRFTLPPDQTPDLWFLDAAEAGLGLELELMTLRTALSGLAGLPPETYLSVNASPDLICDRRFAELLDGYPRDRLLIEISEHTMPDSQHDFAQALARLQRQGLHLAIDDVGAGYSGLQRIGVMAPDLLKIDRSLADGIDRNPTHRAIVSALLYFAKETGAKVLVEGVETEAEAAVLQDLGVGFAQGWLFGRPERLAQIKAA